MSFWQYDTDDVENFIAGFFHFRKIYHNILAGVSEAYTCVLNICPPLAY